MAQPLSFATTLQTSLSLIDQFLASLDPSTTSQAPQSLPSSDHPPPSHLLSASASSLKSTTTKLSLLVITTPLTLSAVASTLQPLHTSILPSLVTATLLIHPTHYPQAYSNECISLSRATLRDLKALLVCVKKRSEISNIHTAISDADKKNVTEVTGKVWEDCDLLIQFASEGIAGFVCKKASQWLELMRDAVKEFEEWDPEEELDDDDPFGLDDTGSVGSNDETGQGDKDPDRVAMSIGVKDQALRVLNRIPQSVHVVMKQRLEKLPKDLTPPMPAARKKTVDRVLKKTRRISECIDESAEGMYMGDLELCLKKAGEARALTIEVVEAVVAPWEASEKETKQDQYVRRALAWIQQVEPSGGKGQAVANNTEKGKEKA